MIDKDEAEWERRCYQAIEASASPGGAVRALSRAVDAYRRESARAREEQFRMKYATHQLVEEYPTADGEQCLWLIEKPGASSWDLRTHITATSAASLNVCGDAGTCVLYPGSMSAFHKLRWAARSRDVSYVLGKGRGDPDLSDLRSYSTHTARLDVFNMYASEAIGQGDALRALEIIDKGEYGESSRQQVLVCVALYEELQADDLSESLEGFGLVLSSNALHCISAIRRCYELVWEKHNGAPPWARRMAWMPSPWA